MQFYWLEKFSDSKKTFPKIKKKPLESTPIAHADNKEQVLLASLVSDITKAKNSNQNADTSKLENRIDFLVYHLYGLTYDEVLVVDPQTPITREEYEAEG